MADIVLAWLIGAAIWTWILYLVIRNAVTTGILTADRRRQLAEAERQLTLAQQSQGQGHDPVHQATPPRARPGLAPQSRRASWAMLAGTLVIVATFAAIALVLGG